jgi:enoyl-CoA hydratase
MADSLLTFKEGEITRLVLNRPHKANALDAELVEALLEAVSTAYHDKTQVLTLEGSGRNFSAGFDFTEYETFGEGDLVLRFLRIEKLLQQVYHAPFVTVAFAHGRNFGAGADLVCACSRRIAAPGATFRMPGLRFGILLGTRRLAQRIGSERARRILSASQAFDAIAALQMNFIHALAEPIEWPDLVREVRTTAALLDPSAKEMLHRLTIEDTRDVDMASLVESLITPGLKERIRVFRETS